MDGVEFRDVEGAVAEVTPYRDGVPTQFGEEIVRPVPGGLGFLVPEEIELVEVHTGIRTPTRFSRWPGDTNDCGAVAVRSKRRADRSR